jgi:uncharacterized membrane protein
MELSDLNVLKSRSADNAIQSDSLSLTRWAGVGAAIVALGTAINPVFDVVVGKHASNAVKASILIAAIAAWAVIVAADMLSRGYADSQTKHAEAERAAATVYATAQKNALSVGKATITTDTDEGGYYVAALRLNASQPADSMFLLVKKDKHPTWVKATDVTIDMDYPGE